MGKTYSMSAIATPTVGVHRSRVVILHERSAMDTWIVSVNPRSYCQIHASILPATWKKDSGSFESRSYMDRRA